MFNPKYIVFCTFVFLLTFSVPTLNAQETGKKAKKEERKQANVDRKEADGELSKERAQKEEFQDAVEDKVDEITSDKEEDEVEDAAKREVSYDERRDELEKGEITVVGDAQLQKVISDGEKFPASTGLGLIWHRMFKEHERKETAPRTYRYLDEFELEAIINVASTVDKIEAFSTREIIEGDTIVSDPDNLRQYGSFLLVPTNSGQAGMVNFRLWARGKNWNNPNSYNCQHGWDFSFAASNREWVLSTIDIDSNQAPIDTTSTTSINATALKFTGGFFLEFVPTKTRVLNNYSAIGGINFSMRVLMGDLGFRGNDTIRQQFLGGADNIIYAGVEPFFEIRVKNIRIFAKMPLHFAPNSRVLGLTGAQFYTGIRITGGFTAKLN